MKNIKSFLRFLFIILLLTLYYFWRFNADNTNTEELSKMSNLMLQVPFSIVYVILSVSALYFLGQIPFFKGIQLQQKELFVKQRKSTTKEIFATIIFGLLVVVLMIGFIIIIFQGTK